MAVEFIVAAEQILSIRLVGSMWMWEVEERVALRGGGEPRPPQSEIVARRRRWQWRGNQSTCRRSRRPVAVCSPSGTGCCGPRAVFNLVAW